MGPRIVQGPGLALSGLEINRRVRRCTNRLKPGLAPIPSRAEILAIGAPESLIY